MNWPKKMENGFSSLRTELRTEVNSLRTAVNSLIEATPNSFASRYQDFVVQSPNPKHDLVHGATATWTFILHGRNWYAVGAAHCALFYKREVRNNLTFVQLPMGIISAVVVEVLFPKQLTCRSTASDWRYDVAVVRLKHAPSVTSASPAPHWPIAASHRSFSSVGGWATSGPVVGGYSWFDEQEGVYTFLETHGEPGHSGTLMCNPRGDPIGVYWGVRKAQRERRYRGVCVPLPNVEEMEAFAPIPSLCPRFYCTKSSSHQMRKVPRFGAVELEDTSRWWPGVLVKATLHLNGSACAGASRCQ